DGLLGPADKLYRDAQRVAVDVRRALRAHDRALAVLPYYTRWLAEQAASLDDEKLLADLWKQVHDLRRGLEQPDPVRAHDLGRLAETVEKGLAGVKELFGQKVGEPNVTRQDRWHDIERVLQVPFIDPDIRLQLVQASRRISRELDEATRRAT